MKMMMERITDASPVDYKKVNRAHWTPEQIEEHLRRIGADKAPRPRRYADNTITAPQKGYNNKYIKKGGASW